MLINHVQCDKCDSTYDEALSRCPHCKEPNKNRATLYYKNKVAFIPIAHQIACFAIGLAGLFIFQLIFSFAFIYLKDSDTTKYTALFNFPSYACVFVCLFAVLFGYLGEIADHFKKARPYLMGLAFGAGLIIFSILYNLLISKVYPTGLNDNEDTARKLATSYPYLSIIVLCFIGPICEEITYRIGLFSLTSRFNRHLAYIITIVLFALIHFNFSAKDLVTELVFLPVYVVSGFLLCLAYEKEGPACSITAHILNNLYAVIGVLIANAIK